MHRSGAHKRLWDFCLEYVSELRSRTALGLPSLNGRTPHELVTGDTPDISEWTEFSFYQPVYYYHSSDFPEPRGGGSWTMARRLSPCWSSIMLLDTYRIGWADFSHNRSDHTRRWVFYTASEGQSTEIRQNCVWEIRSWYQRHFKRQL